MKLNNKTYDTLKWVLTIVVPATIGLIVTLGNLYHFETDLITGTISAIATFIGAIFIRSNVNYNRMIDDIEEADAIADAEMEEAESEVE